jgi:hypothetical protein
MIDLLGMTVLPSMADLVNELLKGAAREGGGYIMRKLLTVECTHEACKEKFEKAICNGDHNDIECPNCHKSFRQFTNVCSSTLKETGQIAHIGIAIGPTWYNRWWTGFIDIPEGEYLFVGFKGQQIVERNLLRDYETNKHFSTDDYFWHPKSDFWTAKMFLRGHSNLIPEKYRNYGQLLVLETELRSRHNHLLATERDVFEWKPDL